MNKPFVVEDLPFHIFGHLSEIMRKLSYFAHCDDPTFMSAVQYRENREGISSGISQC